MGESGNEPAVAKGRIDVVGMIGARSFADGDAAIADADIVIGDRRHLHAIADRDRSRSEELRLPFAQGVARIIECFTAGLRVTVLASGDPGFFGITRALAHSVPAEGLHIHPAPSSVAMAFARVALPWDDAVVVSAHGRALTDTAALVERLPKAAVLTGPTNTPELLGQLLVELGCGPRRVVVVSCIGEPDEQLADIDLPTLANGHFDHRSVVLLLGDRVLAPRPQLHWGRPVHEYAHRKAMITKPEVRAVALSKLELPHTGVLWDVGAGSGSVAIEAAGLCPGLNVIAIEHDLDDARRISDNAAASQVTVRVVTGTAPDAFAGLPHPDRVFIGGGGIEVLDAAWNAMPPGATLVATFAGLGRATSAAHRLGQLVQITVNQATPIGADGELRFAADNPVFICWGTKK